jgi:CheY-like chemotaxis protein
VLCGPSDPLKVLVVDSASLHEHVCALVQSTEHAVSVVGHDAAMSRLTEGQFDVVLLTVGESVIRTMVVAGKMRAIERRDLSLRHSAIVACTSSLGDYRDCAYPGSGLSDALNAPWTLETVHACLDRWRAGKYLGELLPT